MNSSRAQQEFLRRTIPLILLVSLSSAAFAQSNAMPTLLTNMHQIRALPKDAAGVFRKTARLRGTVTFVLRDRPAVIFQEGSNGMLAVSSAPVTNLTPGTFIEAAGPLKPNSLSPYIEPARLTVLGQTNLPAAELVTWASVNEGNVLGRFVAVRGFVRDMVQNGENLAMWINHDRGHFQLHVNVEKNFQLPHSWKDAEIEARGTCWTDPRGGLYGFQVYLAGTNFIKVITPGSTNAFERPLWSIKALDAVLTNSDVRVRTRGVVTHAGLLGEFFFEDEGVPMMARFLRGLPRNEKQTDSTPFMRTMLHPGDVVEVIGSLSRNGLGPLLADVECKRIGQTSPPPALHVTADELMSGKHWGKLVRLKARLLDWDRFQSRPAYIDRLILQSGDHVFTVGHQSLTNVTLQLTKNSYVEVTGINTPQSGRWNQIHSLNILVRDMDDIRQIAPPAFWQRPNVMITLSIVGGVILLAGTWILLQRRQMIRTRASEERFRALIENSFDVTFVFTADGTAKYASPSAARLLGRPEHTGGFVNLTFSEVIHPEDLPIIIAAHQDVLKEPGRSKRVERYRVVRKDGTIRYAEAVGTNCLHVPGVKGVVVNVRDITERELARQELERSELVQRRINEFATSLSPLHTEEDIVWEITRRCISVLGFEDCVIYLLDHSRGVLSQKAAYGPKNPRGREIVSPIEIVPGRGIVGSVAVSGRPEIIADTTKDPRYIVDDATRLSEITVPIVAEGRVIGVIDSEHTQRGFFTHEHLAVLVSIASLAANKLVRARAEAQLQRLNEDLERRVEERTAELGDINTRLRAEVVAREVAEAELRVALAAEKELSQLKSSFVSMISHEFRTPLEVILSSSNILDRYLERLPAEKRKTQLRAIRKSVHRMNDLVEDVLLLGKFDAGRLVCTPVPLNLPEICRRVTAEVETAAGREGAIQFHTDDIDDEASADETLLVHILGNLLGNALKYSGSEEPVDFTITRHGPDAEFVVSDRGCGIPVADRSRLFTAFYRGGNVGHTRGTGLGLAIVKRCVDLHDGVIRCDSEEGRGTTFTVTLPLFDGTRRFRRKPSTESQLS